MIAGIVRALLGDDHCYEYYGDRVRLFLGDLKRWDEREGGYRAGPEFSFTIDVYDHVGEFDGHPAYEDRKPMYLSHGFSILLWRWGIAVSIRGREIDDEWGRPRWQLNRDGTVKEDWR